MTDYTWPSVYFAYFFFTISLGLAVYLLRAVVEGRVLGQGRGGSEVCRF